MEKYSKRLKVGAQPKFLMAEKNCTRGAQSAAATPVAEPRQGLATQVPTNLDKDAYIQKPRTCSS